MLPDTQSAFLTFHPDLSTLRGSPYIQDWITLVPDQIPLAYTNPIFVDFVTMPSGTLMPDGKVGPIYPNSTGKPIVVK